MKLLQELLKSSQLISEYLEVVPNDTADISTVTSESSEVQTASVNCDILSEAVNYINFDSNVFANIHGDKGEDSDKNDATEKYKERGKLFKNKKRDRKLVYRRVNTKDDTAVCAIFGTKE